jgi:diketogulonate reductase-like aldo/keto reductase
VNPGFSSRNLAKLAEVNHVLSEIGKADGKTPSQVALNWVIRNENVVAIPGVKRAEHAIDDEGASGWMLNTSELEMLEKAATAVRFEKFGAVQNLLGALRHYGEGV